MLDTAVTLDVAVTAVMVREEQALVRDNFSSTATSEEDDSIFQGCLVDTVDVLGGQFETFGLHVSDPL